MRRRNPLGLGEQRMKLAPVPVAQIECTESPEFYETHPSPPSQFPFAFNSSNQFSITISLSGTEFDFLIIRKRWSSCDTA